MNRLREEVANFEAVDARSLDSERKPIPDDVKLLVWSRDRGACVKCGANKDLHFDHIISVALGGSNEAENIQVLCRTCNLTKGPRLV
jgi:5-methylcytosine-specific restriction endonuclease McrA